jgi:hypothetical protein
MNIPKREYPWFRVGLVSYNEGMTIPDEQIAYVDYHIRPKIIVCTDRNPEVTLYPWKHGTTQFVAYNSGSDDYVGQAEDLYYKEIGLGERAYLHYGEETQTSMRDQPYAKGERCRVYNDTRCLVNIYNDEVRAALIQYMRDTVPEEFSGIFLDNISHTTWNLNILSGGLCEELGVDLGSPEFVELHKEAVRALNAAAGEHFPIVLNNRGFDGCGAGRLLEWTLSAPYREWGDAYTRIKGELTRDPGPHIHLPSIKEDGFKGWMREDQYVAALGWQAIIQPDVHSMVHLGKYAWYVDGWEWYWAQPIVRWDIPLDKAGPVQTEVTPDGYHVYTRQFGSWVVMVCCLKDWNDTGFSPIQTALFRGRGTEPYYWLNAFSDTQEQRVTNGEGISIRPGTALFLKLDDGEDTGEDLTPIDLASYNIPNTLQPGDVFTVHIDERFEDMPFFGVTYKGRYRVTREELP